MSLSDPRKVIEDVFMRGVGADALDFRGDCLDRLDRDGFSYLEIHFAAQPRKAGRDLVEAGTESVGEGRVDLSAWRVCDLLAADLLLRLPVGEGLLERLYFQGDAEERRMVLRALPFVADKNAVVRLAEEAHRTNDEVLFESGTLDSDLSARHLDDDAYNRIVLKCAFVGFPKERLLGWETRGNAALSMTLFDFMTERQAAGRPVWPDTAPICALAPESLHERVKTETDGPLRAALDRFLASI